MKRIARISLFSAIGVSVSQGAHAFGGSLFSAQMRTSQEIIAIVMEFFVKYSLNLLGSTIVLCAGWIVAKFIGAFVRGLLIRRHADVTITKFLVGILKALILTCALLVALGNFGITIFPFIAGLSVLGFGTSFALQGPLSNYAAGATLVFTKPFRVGDIVEVGEWVGEVEDMTLARTMIKTVDGTRVVIPNKKIIGEVLHNYSEFKKLDIKVGVSYGTDMDKAVALVKKIISDDRRVTQRPQPKVGISELGESGVVIYARIWCKQSDYWDLMFDVNKSIYDTFKKNSVTIPFPQRDVHLYNEKK